jgi:diguanylate cyclase (GGDEF)-like protein
MPFEKIDKGQHVGMTADYLAIMAQKIGKPILLVPTTTWVQTLMFAQTRKCDIFSLAMETEDRKKYMDFTQPYLSIPVVIASRTDKFFIPDMSALGDKKLGVVRGYAIGEILRKEYPEMNIVDVDSLHQGLEMVVKDDLYGFIGTMVTVGYEFQRNFVGELKIVGKFDRKWELGIATRNDEPLLRNIFQKAIESISEKQKQEILNRWLAIRYEKAVDYGQLWKWLIAPLVILAFLLYRNFLLKSYNNQLEIISITDKLTQTYNRVKLDNILEEQEALFQRYEQIFSIIIIDIDFFKRVNDQFGHQTGDKVLIEFSTILNVHIRTTDILGRWGGEEFMLILPKTKLKEALILAEKLRKLIQAFSFSSVGVLTASFGVSERTGQKDSTLNDLVFQADQALYQAKNEGRNRVVKYAEEH